jgi:hypothetical protein
MKTHYLLILFCLISLFVQDELSKEHLNDENNQNNNTDTDSIDNHTILPYITTEDTIQISDADLYQQSLDDKTIDTNKHENTLEKENKTFTLVPPPNQYPVYNFSYSLGSIRSFTYSKKRNKSFCFKRRSLWNCSKIKI